MSELSPAAEKELVIPPAKVSLADRLAYCEQVREKLRREHNAQGALFRDGKLTEAEWEAYKRDVFGPKNTATSNAILAIRQEPKTAARALADDSAAMLAVDLDATFREAR